MLTFTLLFHTLAHAGVLDIPEVTIFYEGDSPALAERVSAIYPSVGKELASSLAIELSGKPIIVLTKDRDAFVRAAGGSIFIAYAVPHKNLIVLDASSMSLRSDTLGSTLKHEVCHLVLHRTLSRSSLPRWLDEGICQWVSGGISEIVSPPGGRALGKAALSGRILRMSDIEEFPPDEAGIILAYEQSKSFIEFIVNRYGSDRISHILLMLREGYPLDEAFQNSVALDLADLEQAWRLSLSNTYSWFFYVSDNLPLILFMFGGLVTIYGFVRFLLRKKAYRDEDDGEET